MKSTYIYIGLVVLIVGGLILVRNSTTPGNDPARITKFDDFAQCLSDAGAKFYGAFWCPHCQEQKKLFDNSSKIPYVECSTPDTKSQLPVCTELDITGYPTWIFADGSRISQTTQLDELGEKTSCTPPTV